MAWVTIPGSDNWEYNNTPVEPNVNNIGQHALWSKQTGGVRTKDNGMEVYTECRLIGSTMQSAGELSKTYYEQFVTGPAEPEGDVLGDGEFVLGDGEFILGE